MEQGKTLGDSRGDVFRGLGTSFRAQGTGRARGLMIAILAAGGRCRCLGLRGIKL